MPVSALKPHTDIRYRSDVDGLRAVAIVSVLLFHAFPNLVPGGFIGVDVFFVISGFLITQIIVNALDRGTFSFATFYYRRARRLLPSLALVLTCTAAAAFAFLFSPEVEKLGRHLISGLLFTLNFAMTKEAGYFDTEAAAKPLLHLWSLGVEEQFYLFWPFLIFILSSAPPKRVLVIGISALGLLSFALNLAFVETHPVGTFYLPHGRFWEMICGALITFVRPDDLAKIHESRAVRSLLSCGGLLAIGLGLKFCDAHGVYPGWLALFPVLGTTAVILAGPKSWLNRTVLSSALFVFIGYLSYPLYLWHWPILAYLHIATFGEPTFAARIAALLLAATCSVLTFYVLELPIRNGRRYVSVKQIAIVAIVVALIGVGLKKGARFINPLPPSMKQHTFLTPDFVASECLIPHEKRIGHDVEFCQTDLREPPNAAVWGDSKADAIYAGLVPESHSGQRWLLMARAGCAPLKDVERNFYYDDPGPGCTRSNRLMLETLLAHPEIKTVLVTSATRVLYGPSYHEPGHSESPRSADDGMIAALSQLLQNGKTAVYLVDNPTLADPERCVPRPLFHSSDPKAECEITEATFRARTAKLSNLLRRIQTELPKVIVVDATSSLCGNGRCAVEDGGQFLYAYTDHLSDFGARKVARVILAAIAQH